MESLVFVELPNFSRHVYDYLTEDEYIGLQFFLNHRPSAGEMVRGSGGCRKLRWGVRGRGKRGGVRVIYYYRSARDEMWMLTIYAKNEVENVPGHILRRLREEIDNG
jgi:mRNA-degrading endonuclease RelE of RelBE toxin-antitoxin system